MQVAKACDAGKTTRFDAAGAGSCWPARNAVKVAGEAIQALGGAGYTKDWPVERYWRDAKLLDIGGGDQRGEADADRPRADRPRRAQGTMTPLSTLVDSSASESFAANAKHNRALAAALRDEGGDGGARGLDSSIASGTSRAASCCRAIASTGCSTPARRSWRWARLAANGMYEDGAHPARA